MKRINEFKERIPEIKKMLTLGMSIGKISKIINLEPTGLLSQMRLHSNEFENIKFRIKGKDVNK